MHNEYPIRTRPFLKLVSQLIRLSTENPLQPDDIRFCLKKNHSKDDVRDHKNGLHVFNLLHPQNAIYLLPSSALTAYTTLESNQIYRIDFWVIQEWLPISDVLEHFGTPEISYYVPKDVQDDAVLGRSNDCCTHGWVASKSSNMLLAISHYSDLPWVKNLHLIFCGKKDNYWEEFARLSLSDSENELISTTVDSIRNDLRKALHIINNKS